MISSNVISKIGELKNCKARAAKNSAVQKNLKNFERLNLENFKTWIAH